MESGAAVVAYREQCLRCFRPKAHCYCALLPRVDNRTPVVIVQHPRERFHPFGTARMLGLGLQKVRIVVDHSSRLRQSGAVEFGAGAALLYPGPGARDLAQLPASEQPRELVIIDGTWNHAHTLFRDVPELRELPRVRLSPSTPGRYRIRAEPRAECLSSLEATVQALQQMEPQTQGLAELLQAFESIIDRQIVFLKPGLSTRHPKRSRPPELRKFPRALVDDEVNLVVAYGDSVPSGTGQDKQALHWVAQRFASGETFECLVAPPDSLSAEQLAKHLHHMQLGAQDLSTAVSLAGFAEQWRGFLRPQDVVVAYNQSSIDQLSQAELAPRRAVVLKAVYFNLGRQYGSLDQIVDRERLRAEPCPVRGRAAHRLGNAIELVRFLRHELAQIGC